MYRKVIGTDSTYSTMSLGDKQCKIWRWGWGWGGGRGGGGWGWVGWVGRGRVLFVHPNSRDFGIRYNCSLPHHQHLISGL